MKSIFLKADNFNSFKADIKSFLLNRDRKIYPLNGFRRSSVLILMTLIDSAPHVLLTKRTETVKTHKGQVSFPGGAFEDVDKTIINTALRETLEETGIQVNPADNAGIFDDYISVTDYHVSTVVAVSEFIPECNINNDEIESCLLVPVSIFANRQYYKTEDFTHNGTTHTVYFYKYSDYIIWGLTARILMDLSE